VTAATFAALTPTLDQARLPGISGVAPVVPGTDAEVPRLQRLWRARGNRQLRLAPAGTADEHLFSVLTRTLDGTAPRTGQDLRVMALTDSLTGLANRRAFMVQLDQSHARAVRQNSPVCVLFCDVDRFKTINDTYGHAAGDALLEEVATRLQHPFRTEDTVGRLGGDEFAVICENGPADCTMYHAKLAGHAVA